MKTHIALILALAGLFAVAQADTIVPAGNVSGTWTAAGSPYLVQGNITVPAGDSLAIGPGVSVVFQGHFSMTVGGVFSALGAQGDSILFTSVDTSAGWLGMILGSGAVGTLDYCIIQYGKKNGPNPFFYGGGIYCSQSVLTINHSLIRQNYALSGGGLSFSDSYITITHTDIINNSANGSGGIESLAAANYTLNLNACNISQNTALAYDGQAGGIYVNGPISADSCTFMDNVAMGQGGAFRGYYNGYTQSPHTFQHCVFIGNQASVGGALYLEGGSSNLIQNSLISGNNATRDGGGLFCNTQNLSLSGVTIKDNSCGDLGGGIWTYDPISFDSHQRCNIYANNAGSGNDLYAYSNIIVNVYADTFSVQQPTNFHAYPLNKFTFSILHGQHSQANADLYVSPTGNDSASGLSWADPLKTIFCALSSIVGSAASPHGIHIAAGHYSSALTGEKFPLSCVNYISLTGVDVGQAIVDANSEGRVFYLHQMHDFSLSNLTIRHGQGNVDAGGIYCDSSQATINDCLLDSNIVVDNEGGGGGGIYATHSTLTVNNCSFRNNQAQSFPPWGVEGGGIRCDYDSSTFNYCVISDNTASAVGDGGGGISVIGGQPIFRNCAIFENYSPHGGGGKLSATTCLLQNCTFSHNTSFTIDAAGILLNSASPTISNTIVEGCVQGSAIKFSDSPNALIKYCDFANNPIGNFSGSNIPPGLGIIYQLNANGDSCDNHYNIFLDPQFVDPDSGDYHLQAGSPCIDAGDPALPHDPDFTVADIGAFYFDQATPVIIGLLPHNPPIVIPAQGGSFQFDCQIHNNDSTAHVADLYLNVTLPGGGNYPIASRTGLSLPIGASIARNNLTQVVPGSAGPGNYAYNAFLREHTTWVLLSQASFPFQKTYGDASASKNDDWTLLGWDEPQKSSLPDHFIMSPPTPNPFNATTTIRYQMPEARQVSLRVYDTAGRLVTTLVDGWREAGAHEVTFDASKLASGLYIVRMQAETFTAVQKMVMVK